MALVWIAWLLPRPHFPFLHYEKKKTTKTKTQAGVAAGAWTRARRGGFGSGSVTNPIYFLFLGATSHSRTRRVGPGDVEGSLSSDSETDHFNPSSSGAEKEQSSLGIVYLCSGTLQPDFGGRWLSVCSGRGISRSSARCSARGPQCVLTPWCEWRQLRGGSTPSAEGGAERGDGEPRGCLPRVRLQDPTLHGNSAFSTGSGGFSLDIRMLFHLRSRSEHMIVVESSGSNSLLCSALL